MNIVIDSSAKTVLRFGACAMDINPATEELVVSDFIFNPSIRDMIWKYEDGVFVIDALEVSKHAKIAAVRARTEYEESLGIPYNGSRFSVTPSAKSNWLAVVVASPGLTYPFSAPTGFGSIYEFQNVGDVQAFFGASMYFLKYWEESNEALVIAVNACTTVEQVDAIVDDRVYPPV